jgi:hypothetical protein
MLQIQENVHARLSNPVHAVAICKLNTAERRLVSVKIGHFTSAATDLTGCRCVEDPPREPAMPELQTPMRYDIARRTPLFPPFSRRLQRAKLVCLHTHTDWCDLFGPAPE